MNKHKIIIIFIISSLIFILTGCSNLEYDTSRDKVIMSPDNSYSLTIRYDHVSRPFIFKDGKLIYEYEGPGFMESVGFNIKWVSDDEILLYLESPQKEKYAKEKFYIKIK